MSSKMEEFAGLRVEALAAIMQTVRRSEA